MKRGSDGRGKGKSPTKKNRELLNTKNTVADIVKKGAANKDKSFVERVGKAKERKIPSTKSKSAKEVKPVQKVVKSSPTKTALKSTTSLTTPKKAVQSVKPKLERRISDRMKKTLNKPAPKNVQKTIKKAPPTKGR